MKFTSTPLPYCKGRIKPSGTRRLLPVPCCTKHTQGLEFPSDCRSTTRSDTQCGLLLLSRVHATTTQKRCYMACPPILAMSFDEMTKRGILLA
jgi:hypothetical protein